MRFCSIFVVLGIISYMEFLRLIAIYLIESFLLAIIITAFMNITPDSAGKNILIIGFSAIGMVGIFLIFNRKQHP